MAGNQHSVEARRDERGGRWEVCTVCGQVSAIPAARPLATLICTDDRTQEDRDG